MRNIKNIALLVFGSLVLLSLISCTTKSDVVEQIASPTNVSTPDGFATLVNVSSTTIASIQTTTPNPTWTPVLTVTPFLIPDGRVLFQGAATKNGADTFGLTMLNTETNETTFIMQGNQKVDDTSIILFSSNIAISPDGHWIASVGSDVRANVWIYAYQDIYISRTDGTKLYRLTYSPQYDKNQLIWSPDGESILVAMGKNGSRDLYLINIHDGGILWRITSSGNVVTGTWSPDGQRIAFIDNSKLFFMDIKDKSIQFLSNLPDSTVQEISWSPLGDKLALSILGNNIGCGDIFIYDLATKEIKNLTDDDYAEKSPSWLPDGQHLVFSRAKYSCGEPVGQGVWDIYMSDTTGNKMIIVPEVGYQTSVSWIPVPSLKIGKQYITTELGANLNLRSNPSLNGKILTKLPVGEVITVLEGFVDADDYYWWKIQAQDGTEGWAVEVANWYKPLIE